MASPAPSPRPGDHDIEVVVLVNDQRPGDLRDAGAVLREIGYVVYGAAPDADLRTAVADLCVLVTTEADAVAVLPDWQRSPFARAAYAVAVAAGLPVLDAETGQVVADPNIEAAIARHPAGSLRPHLSIAETLATAPQRPDLSVVPTLPHLIGLIAYAQVGKDTVAEILADTYGYRIDSPSNVLRDFLYAQDLYLPPSRKHWWSRPRSQRLCDVVDEHGWPKARLLHPYIRDLQQATGTEAGRTYLGEDVWQSAMLARLAPGERHVSTRVMYANEAQAILDAGGILVRVTRPGTGPLGDHSSEAHVETLPADYTIENDGTVGDLRVKVIDLIEQIRSRSAAA